MLIWTRIRQQSDSNRTQLFGVASSAVGSLRSPHKIFQGAYGYEQPHADQHNLQERLKSAQDECQPLSAENTHLRVLLGLMNRTHDPVANIIEPFV
jgi:hypothetical protein